MPRYCDKAENVASSYHSGFSCVFEKYIYSDLAHETKQCQTTLLFNSFFVYKNRVRAGILMHFDGVKTYPIFKNNIPSFKFIVFFLRFTIANKMRCMYNTRSSDINRILSRYHDNFYLCFAI